MLNCQKDLFQLPGDIHYLNCGYMGPLPRATEEAGIRGMMRKRNPSFIMPEDFFNEAEELRKLFGVLINASFRQVAIIPSASYGLMAAVNNLPAGRGNHIIGIADEFPSGHYAIRRWAAGNNKTLHIIEPPAQKNGRGKKWNEDIVAAINPDTTAVLISSIHWTDGTIFNLPEIGKRCRETDTWFIVDGTQSVGAMHMDVKQFNIDALVCAGYKWLLGPYSAGLAYYSERFNNGRPLEETWMNRMNAADFAGLTTYTDEYTPGAGRYNAGEFSQFIHTPMLTASLTQILDWGVKNIGQRCALISDELIKWLQKKEFRLEEDGYRAQHLFGFGLPSSVDPAQLIKRLREHKIFVSQRKDMIRVSPHVYNDENDFAVLQDVLSVV
jgi:selenocysteine lyase/cysteine desulfurase